MMMIIIECNRLTTTSYPNRNCNPNLDYTTPVSQRSAAPDSQNPLDGLRVGRVRVVFSLPPNSIANLFPPNVDVPPHLAYIEWFTRFTARPDARSHLQLVKRDKAPDGNPLVSVIPVSLILGAVALFPKWGHVVPAAWSAENVLDRAPSFLVNNYRNQRDFYKYH